MARASQSLLVIAAAASIVVASACEPRDVQGLCEPGEVQACACASGSALGTQRCASDGSEWGPCQCSPVDGGVDGDADGDADARGDADLDDGGEEWSPLAGCTGVVSDERWLVAAVEEGRLVGYLTGRDCAEPERLCEGCYPASFSPSGDRALVVLPSSESWRLEDEIALVDLSAPDHALHFLDIRGTLPVWVDDDSFDYVTAATGVMAPCAEHGEPPERCELRRHEPSSGEDEALGPPVSRAWIAGFPVPAGGGTHLAFGFDVSSWCDLFSVAVAIRDLATGTDAMVEWTADGEWHFAGGLLPEGGGFLVERSDRVAPLTRLYAVSFGGEAAALGTVDGRVSFSLVGTMVRGYWPPCGSVRRLGPACELYCQSSTDGRWYRIGLLGEEPEPVACDVFADEIRIMDVWQR